MAIVVRSFTISKVLEVNFRGEKQQEFISMKFESDVSLTPEQAHIQALEAHRIVEESLVYNSLASGMITGDAAKDRLEEIRGRHTGMVTALKKKYGDTNDVEAFLKSAGPETMSSDDPPDVD